MKRCCCFIFALYFVATAGLTAQDLRLPRNSEVLVDRVQRFWAAFISGKRFEALQFVHPDKKELFLAGNAVPILKAQVLGVDLTSDPDRASIRVAIQVLATSLAAGESNWTITDSWVWNQDNWYLNLEAPPDIFRRSSGSGNELDVAATQKQLEQFAILRDPLDVGTLTNGDSGRVEIPIRYTGELPVSVELALNNPLVSLEFESSIGIDRNSTHFVALVNTETSAGPFTISLPLKIRYQAVSIERSLVLKGNVFFPIAFRQSPPNGPIEAGRPFSLFVRNNTKQEVGIGVVSADGKLDIVKRPDRLPPGQEIEIVLKLKPGESPERLYLELAAPLNGRTLYIYRFRNSSR